ncbi:neuralized-like protein 4 [Branchiostoma floridae]|uniref:Neuralized-like protein 4 n=1 Tax=Branchiostoma floridae TaxID=7739 RepID=A0A9J7NCC7_BRAFL|nr:neuralized-like protein 4 [Branchiostoma floridae]
MASKEKVDTSFSAVASKVQGTQAKWYHGMMSREDAEVKLKQAGVGSFLIRQSQRPGKGFILSANLKRGFVHFSEISISSDGLWTSEQQTQVLDYLSRVEVVKGNPLIANEKASGASFKTTCPYWKLCKEYKDSLKLYDEYFEPSYDMCYCTKCHNKRGEKDVYTRGDPPMKYVLPIGWCRFSLKVPPKAKAQNVFKKWHVCFHGTDSTAVDSILGCGDLLMPGDYAVGGRKLSEKEGHFTDERKPEGFDTKQIFLSPSIKYSGCDVYAKPKTFATSAGKVYDARVAFQVCVRPESYKIGPETIGATRKNIKIDPHVDNDKIECFTKERGSTILYGLLVNMEETNT